MSLTKDGFDNIEGQMFEVIRGVEGDCLTLGDEDGGTRISGPKPWGGGQVVKTFVTCEKYGPIEHLEAENTKLRELVRGLHMAYVGAINKCESLDEALIWEFSGNIDDDVAKSKEEYESDRHRFDVAMRELGVTDD